MGDRVVLERIAAWQAAGLIDAATAERLRAAEATTEASAPAPRAGVGWLAGHGGLSAAEFFGYLGGAFVLAAYYWIVAQNAQGEGSHAIGIAAGIAAAGFLAVGYALRKGTGGRARATGALLLVGGLQAWWSILQLLDTFVSDSELRRVVASLLWLGIAVLAGRAAVGLATRAGALVASSASAWTAAGLLGTWMFPPVPSGDEFQARGARPLEALLLFVWFALVGAALGWFAEREAAGSEEDPSHWRRVTLTRSWAAMTVIVGGSAAIFGWALGPGGGLEALIGAPLLLAACGAIAFLALRIGSFAYLLPVGLGVFIALTDLNRTYVVDSTGLGPALLLEGLALIAVGWGLELLRRRLAARGTAVEPTGGPVS
jgi:hypothetical protein